MKGIHLSPAYYHIWPLSLRIAGQYPNTIIENIPLTWMQQLDEACAGNEEVSSLIVKTKTQRQFRMSRMLEKQQLILPKTKAILHWQPPAIVILR